VRDELIEAIRLNQAAFGLELLPEKVDRLADFYDLVQEHNPLLHLVARCSPEEFAVRHILESLTSLKYIAKNAHFADVGAGAGLPSIPCLLVRRDLRATLIESKVKKTDFLETAISELRIKEQTQVVNRQFDEVLSDDFSHITCRALDKFSERLARLLRWSNSKSLVLFGGAALGDALRKNRVWFEQELIPLSERRYLFVFEN